MMKQHKCMCMHPQTHPIKKYVCMYIHAHTPTHINSDSCDTRQEFTDVYINMPAGEVEKDGGNPPFNNITYTPSKLTVLYLNTISRGISLQKCHPYNHEAVRPSSSIEYTLRRRLYMSGVQRILRCSLYKIHVRAKYYRESTFIYTHSRENTI